MTFLKYLCGQKRSQDITTTMALSIDGDTKKMISRYISYYLKARTYHHAHSPTVYDFLNQVIEGRQKTAYLRKPMQYRKTMLQKHDALNWKDIGAPSRIAAKKTKISQIAKRISTPPYKGKILAKTVAWHKPQNILELGTAFGVGTAYLASSGQYGQLTTVDGQQELSTMAEKALSDAGYKNIIPIHSDFHTFLESQEEERYDLVFIDGAHTSEATWKIWTQLQSHLSDNSIIIFDDIYWSEDMQRFWTSFQESRTHGYTLDLFHYGLYFNKSAISQPNQGIFIARKWKPWSLVL